MQTQALARLRTVSMAEGLSFILLLFVAMPMKYFGDMPLAVTIVGSLHGILVIAFAIALNNARIERGWGLQRSGLLFLAGMVPFGPFVADRSLREEQERVAAGGS